MTVAVLGPGAVGGTLAVRLEAAGRKVVCIARDGTAAAIRAHGLRLHTPEGTLTSGPAAVTSLVEAADLLLVAVKSPGLDEALARVRIEPPLVVPLLNGLEHVDALRARFSDVVAASVSRFEAFREDATTIRQATSGLVLTLAREIEALRVPGVAVRIVNDERELLWEKAARLGPLAAATAASGLSVGELRANPAWRDRLARAIDEAAAVAAADGAHVEPAAQWAIIDAMAPTLTTSTARDVAAGRPSELDAVAGAIARAGRRLGVPTPSLERMLAECRPS